jgi:hypothetical protein
LAATSYLPVIGLLKAYFKIGDRDDHRDARKGYRQALHSMNPCGGYCRRCSLC